MGRKGFTLIELVMVIIILGILAVVAIPQFYDLRVEARQAAELGVVGGVRAGISTYHANQLAKGLSPVWPADLDGLGSVACNTGTGCFSNVLEQAITDADWSKADTAGTDTYTGPTGATYDYDPTDGSFE